MSNSVMPIKTEHDIERLRNRLADNPKDLFIFDFLTQTGLLLDQVLNLKVQNLTRLTVGESIALPGKSSQSDNLPRMTRRLMESFNQYVESTNLKPDSYLLKSRKGSKPLTPQSVSRLVSTWFRDAGMRGLAGVKSLRKTWEVHYKNQSNPPDTGTEKKSKTGLLGGVQALTLSDQIEVQLIELIVTGQITPGKRLIIKDIADESGISPMPVRDALTRLTAGGIVRQEKNKGYTVNFLSEAEFKEITELRRVLEPIAAISGCRNAKPDDLLEIAQYAQNFEQALQAGESHTGLKINREFHFSLYRMSEQPILLQFLERLWNMVSPYYHLLSKDFISLHSQQLELGKYYQNAYLNHQKIMACLENQNCNELARWIKADIDLSSQKVLTDFYNL